MTTFEIPEHLAVSFFQTYLGGVPSSGKYVARCPVCGDSASRQDKKRMYLLDDNGWHVYCHNCAYANSIYFFIKDFFPEHFDRFKSECVSYNILSNSSPLTKTTTTESDIETFRNLVKKKLELKKLKEKSSIEIFIEKNAYPLKRDLGVQCQGKINRQRKYFLNRGIQPEIVDKFYYCHGERYTDRVLIPFFNPEGKIYYFQARSTMDHQSPKYLNWRDDGTEESESKPEYNEFNVDKNKEVYIVEGLIDSMFVENSVSTLGVSMSMGKIEYYCTKYPNRVFCMDNDDAGWATTMKLLKHNYKCLIFPQKYRHIKDLNDIAMLEGTRDLTEFVKNNCFVGMIGVAKMKQYGIIVNENLKNKNYGGKHDILNKIKNIRRD